MTDLEKESLRTYSRPALPFICPFLLCLAAVISLSATFGLIPSWVYPSRSSPSWSFLRSHSNSLSFAPSLPPIPIVFKNLSSGANAFSFASRPANHLFSTWVCHPMPSFTSSLTSFLLSFLHRRQLVYKCSTDCFVPPQHQHSGVSMHLEWPR